MEEINKIRDCFKLIKILPIDKIDDNITAVSNLIYEEDDLLNEFLQKVDCRTEVCREDGDFLQCEYNREGDSYRSPTSNKYFPAIEDGRYPSTILRDLEIKLNKMFSIYSKAYYSTSTLSSVYCWELGDKIEDGFAVAILIKNNVNLEKEVNKGQWDSNNVLNVSFTESENNKIEVTYKLTTTIVLQMNFEHKICGKVSLSGTVSRQMKETHTAKNYMNEEFHINNIGRIVEESENNLRSTVEEIYLKKSKEILDTARFSPTVGKPNTEQANKLKDVFKASNE